MIDTFLQPFQFPFMQNAFWIALIMKEGDTRSISIIHSVAAK